MQNAGTDVEIKGPDGEPIGITIKVAGPDSKRRKDAKAKQIDKRLQRQSVAEATADDITLTGLEVLADATVSWSGVIP